jgi:hypothetical protein
MATPKPTSLFCAELLNVICIDLLGIVDVLVMGLLSVCTWASYGASVKGLMVSSDSISILLSVSAT